MLLLLPLLAAPAAPWQDATALRPSPSPPTSMRIAAGPTLLAADLSDQWGGHVFSYLLEGERALFWSALLFEDGQGAAVVGSFPLDDRGEAPARTLLPIEVPGLRRVFQPLLIRTPDGYLHAFVGYAEGDPEQGRVAYFRSERPEDVGAMLFRGDVPLGDFVGFHVRQNVALGPAGERMVLAIQSSFARGVHVINIPLVLYGHREGLDFAFTPPIPYHEAQPVFYPLVAALEDDVIVVGQDHNEDDSQRNAWLFHLDWSGNLLEEIELPRPGVPGRFGAHALSPASLDDWNRLCIVRTLTPSEGTVRWIEFWEYDVRRRELHLARSVENDYSLEPSITNAGELLTRTTGPPLFVNNPASGALAAWEGDVFGTGPYRVHRWERTDPRAIGLVRSRSVFAPNPLQGSVVRDGSVHLAADIVLPGTPDRAVGPTGFLAWELSWGDGRADRGGQKDPEAPP